MESYLQEFAGKLASYSDLNNFYQDLYLLALFLIAALASSTFLYYYPKYTYWSRRGIGGPTPIPPFGTNIYDVIYSKNRVTRAWTKRYGKAFGIYHGTRPMLVISDPQIIKDIAIKDAYIFPNHMETHFRSKWTQKMLFFRRDDDWKQLRSLIALTMTSGKIKKMFNLMRESSNELLDHINKSIANKDIIDVKLAYGCFTLDVIARCAFAMKFDNEESERKYRKDLVNMMIGETGSFPAGKLIMIALLPKFLLRAMGVSLSRMKTQNYLADVSRKIIESRHNNHDESHKRHDYLQSLIDLNKSDRNETNVDTIEGDIKESHHVSNYDKQELKDAIRDAAQNSFGVKQNGKTTTTTTVTQQQQQLQLDDDDIIANCLIFFIAGYETNSSLLSFATYSLACHPDAQEKLYQEVKTAIGKETNKKLSFEYETVFSMEYLDAVICETLRMFPPAQTFDRQANSDYKIPSLDLTIPAGTVILIASASVHYDPTYYPEPHKFKPSRFLPENRNKLTPYTYLPFGAGMRHCVGMRFALAEAKLALARMVYNFNFTPAKGSQARFPPKLAKTLSLIGCNELDVAFSKR